MYILSWVFPSPGIEPRMPTVLRWSAGPHTSIVAHSSREFSSARSRASAGAVHRRTPAAQVQTAAGAARPTDSRLGDTMELTIAPGGVPPPRLWYSLDDGG